MRISVVLLCIVACDVWFVVEGGAFLASPLSKHKKQSQVPSILRAFPSWSSFTSSKLNVFSRKSSPEETNIDYNNLPRIFQDSKSSSKTTTRTEAEVDILIVGAGPSGLLLASALARRAAAATTTSNTSSNNNNNNNEVVSIGIIDPVLEKAWPNNYGVWMDEAHKFGFENECDLVWKDVGVIFDEDTPELILERPYGRVDRKKLKKRLVEECVELGNVKFGCARGMDLEHFDDRRSVMTVLDLEDDHNRSPPNGDDDDDDHEDDIGTLKNIKASIIIDCSGFTRKFIQHSSPFNPGYQVTYGARVKVPSHPYDPQRMILMDYSERHLYSDSKLTKSNIRYPSFLYAQPISPNEVFLEETVLVTRPAASSRDLEHRLQKRCQALNMTILETLESERAAIPMGGLDPIVPQRTLGFGATASLVHPASGYMVARAMELAPKVADALIPNLLEVKKEQVRNRDRLNGDDDDIIEFEYGTLDTLAQTGWNAIWPTDERRQRDFMHFGFELLCLLNPQELRDFFTGFFRLPHGLWEHFLSWRLSGVGHVYMGLLVWATCIPKRFMMPMLIKSLPFIFSRLVGPFLSRGDYEKVKMDSWYYDARSLDSNVWEPGNFYDYVNKLRDGIVDNHHHQNNGEDTLANTITANGDSQTDDDDHDDVNEKTESSSSSEPETILQRDGATV